MADIVSCITEPAKAAGKWIGEQIFTQLTLFWFFTTNIKSLRDEEKMLDDATKGLQLQVDKARDNVEVIDPEVVTWLDKAKAIKEKTSKILSEVDSGHLKFGDRLSLSKRAKEMTDSAKGHRDQKKFSVISHSGPSPATRRVPRGKTFECESRNKIEEEIVTALRGGDVNMIGICGMGGLGKTTMAEKIMNRALEENVFQEVVMAVVSQNVDILKIQDEIGRQLRLEKLKDGKLKQAERVDMLHIRLSDTNRTTLLVLDDVWETPPLESIGIPFNSKGCTVLFTSRNRDVLHDMDVPIFGMKVLSEEEAWSFFRERAGMCVDETELNPIAKQVAKECGGLPINLAAVGAGLKDKRIQRIWNHTLTKLKQSVPDNVRYDKKNYNPLKLSYEYLDSKEAQSIFLLCCLFPEDADIPLEYLTNFSMGLGIFEEDITNMEQARDLMCAKTEFLKDRSLLLESDEKDCVRMHDVVRDVCIFIAKEEGYIGKDGCTWISSSHLVGQRNKLLSGSSCPNVSLLFFNRRYDSSGFEFDDAFVEGKRELRVLCIEDYSLTKLPHPTQSLGKLHTLIFVSCYELKTISIVGKLVNLEILICHDCRSIEKLPSEMKGLNRLKVLDLTRCTKLQNIRRGIISSLVGLEELKMYGSFNEWEGENASIKELEALTNLACLEIDIKHASLVTGNMLLLSKKIVRFIIRDDFQRPIPSKFSKAMRLTLQGQTRLGDWIEKKLTRDANFLELSGDGVNNVDLGKSQNLRWLELFNCERMKNLVRTSGGDDATVFPSLERLELHLLPELQEICDGPISSTSFQNLKELELTKLRALREFWKSSSVCENNNVPYFSNLSTIEIYKCYDLRNLGQLSMAGKDCLPQLEELSIISCEMMEQVFLWNNEEVITEVFPKLKEVVLDSLPNLTTFCQGIQGIEFPLLKGMKIKECPKMKSIIGSSSTDIDDSLLLLIFQPQKVFFGSLEVLSIDSIGSMGIFTLSTTANLVSLRVLYIRQCYLIVNVIEDEEEKEDGKVVGGGEIRTVVFPKLEELYLGWLPKLVRFCEWKCDVELPSLTKVEIRYCRNMENFCMGFADAPNLKIVEIDEQEIDASKDLNGALHQHYLARPEKVSFDLVIDYNPFYGHKVPSSFCNRLEELTINKYAGSMSFFTFSMAAKLVSLRELRISNCDEMIKVIEDEEQQERILLVIPKLEILKLKNVPKLVSFCDSKCEVELPSLREVEIERCPNMENFSMGFVATPNLEAFTTDLTTYVGVGVDVAFNSLKKLEIRENDNPLCHHKVSASLFNGLERLEFYRYKGSMSLFSCSAVGNLVNLKVLSMGNCDDILVNVIEDEEEEEHWKVVSGGEIIRSVVIFPKLEELYLVSLSKLVRFCEWKCDVQLPSLTKLEIRWCPNMENFSIGFVAAPNLKIVEIDKEEIDATKDLNGALHQHYLARPKKVSLNLVIAFNPFYGHKVSSSLWNRLEDLTINKYEGSMSFFTLPVALNLVSLRKLYIENCAEMIKVIEDEEQQQRILVFPKLERLYLEDLPKLVTLCDCKCEVELPLLREVMIFKCPNMESFSMGLVATPNLEDFSTDLSTYVGVGVDVAFNSLKELGIRENYENPWYDYKISVSLFNGLEKLVFFKYKGGSMSLFSSSAVIGNLVNLKELFIYSSDEILITIIEDDEKVVSGGEIRSSVVFPQLEELTLYRLPNLVRFCEWKCEVQLPSLTKLKIDECPNMEYFSMGFVAAPNLKFFEIDEEEIDAPKDLNGALQQGYLNRQYGVSYSFHNRALQINQNPFNVQKIPPSLCHGLEELTISKYWSSTSLFTLSMAASLVYLRELRITKCDEMIKVIKDEEQQQRILLFPKLEILKLEYSPKLVSFCDLKCEVELPLLKEVEIERCPNMENLSMGLVATPKLEAFTTDLTTYVGVGVDIAFNSLKRLKIRGENENPFDHHKISVSLFNGLERLIFWDYKGSVSFFLCSAIASLVNLRVLGIEKCNEIVKVMEDDEDGKVVSGGEIRSVVFPKLEELYLYSLPKLVRFCEWKCDVELPSLTKLEIDECPNMESFSMGYVSAPNLKIVNIDGHKDIDGTKDLNEAMQQRYLARQKEILFDSRILEINHNPFYGHEIPSSVFNRLEELTINKYGGSMSLFTLPMAANLVSLRELGIRNCDEMIKVIEDEQQQQRILIFPKLEELYLNDLPNLLTFCHSKCEVELPTLRRVVIYDCPNMKNFSSGLVATPNLKVFTSDLTTYVGVGVDVAFNSLNKLQIRYNENPFDHHTISVSLFNGLEELTISEYEGSMSIFTLSMAANLVSLRKIGILKCDEIINVIEDDEEKVVSGGEIRRVVFPKLEEIRLSSLPKLVSFAEWKCEVELPSLTTVDIKSCPNLKSFSMGFVAAPNLEFVKIDSKYIGASVTKDLNGALQHYWR